MDNSVIYKIDDMYETLYFEDKECALYYIKHISSDYVISEVLLDNKSIEYSNMVITVNEFIDHIENKYLDDYPNNKDIMYLDLLKIKKNKIREEILNKLLND